MNLNNTICLHIYLKLDSCFQNRLDRLKNIIFAA